MLLVKVAKREAFGTAAKLRVLRHQEKQNLETDSDQQCYGASSSSGSRHHHNVLKSIEDVRKDITDTADLSQDEKYCAVIYLTRKFECRS